MPHVKNVNFVLGDPVKDQIAVARQRRHADARLIGRSPRMRMLAQRVGALNDAPNY
jgi:hypothetical protein